MVQKLKYQGGITRHLCRKQAERHKKSFRRLVKKGQIKLPERKEVAHEIISFSGASTFEDQLLSIYSFVSYAGTPSSWTIYSDKTYTLAEKKCFKALFPFVSTLDWDVYDHYQKNHLIKEYLTVCNLAKKINAIIGHPYNGQTFYLDSDILLYKNISYYLNCAAFNKGLWYVPDALENIDAHFDTDKESIYSLNSGFLILNNHFDHSGIYDYLESLNGNYSYFSEQSSFEYAFRQQEAKILDPRQFIIDTSDQFDFSIKYNPDSIAMRHYTSPVRHKMWQNGWKWHFKGLNRDRLK